MDELSFLFNIIAELELSDSDCAAMFGVSTLTIDRWRRGITRPHRVMKELMWDILGKKMIGKDPLAYESGDQ